MQRQGELSQALQPRRLSRLCSARDGGVSMLAAVSCSERQADHARLRATGLQVAAAGRKSGGGRALAWIRSRDSGRLGVQGSIHARWV